MRRLLEEIPVDCRRMVEGLPSSSIKKALASARSGRLFLIWKRPEIMIFVGEERDHLLVPPVFCDCMDYLMNVVMKRQRKYCYHMLSACIAEKEGLLREKVVSDTISVARTIIEIIEYGKALSFRKHLSIPKP